MPKRNFDNWLTAYGNYTRHSEAPDLFHFWTGVFTIAGTLRRRVWIDQRYFQWTPNFYIVLVAPAGVVSKSTTLRTGTSLLEQIPGVKLGPRSVTWQRLTQALGEAQEGVELGPGLIQKMSCLSCAINELGTFLHPDDKIMTDVLVDLWDGQLERWERQTMYEEGKTIVENPWLNIMGCTTPAWIRDNIPEAMIGGGLISRVIFVYGDTKRQLVPYPADAADASEFEALRAMLLNDLIAISKMKGEYRLTQEAKQWGIAWYQRHWEKRPAHMISDRYGGYIARKQTHIHKLAMVIAAAQRQELSITERDLAISDQMITGLEPAMQFVFQSIGVGDISKFVVEILAYVRAYKTIPQRELWRHMMTTMNPREFDEAVSAAVKAGYLRIEGLGTQTTYHAIPTESSQH